MQAHTLFPSFFGRARCFGSVRNFRYESITL